LESKEVIKILFVEDNPGDVVIIMEMLKEIDDIHFEVITADNLKDGLKHLINEDFDILLLDLNLPDSEGIDTFITINQNARDLPIIILTGLSDEEFAISSVGKGAQDYLVKGQTEGQLLAKSIKYSIERKRIEKELRSSEEKYRLMVEKIQSGVFLIDSENKLKYVNESMAKMLGYTVHEMLNRQISHFTDREGESKLKYHLNRLKKGSAQTYELEFINKWGTNLSVLISTSALFKGDGEYFGAISIMTDISARKGMETSLMEAMIEKDKNFFLIMGSMVEAMKPLIQQEYNDDYQDKFT
jgi:two-component system, NarL family, sensor histidine kinase UhpB